MGREGRGSGAEVPLGKTALTPEIILWVTRSHPPLGSWLSALEKKVPEMLFLVLFLKDKKNSISPYPHRGASQGEPN